MISNTDIRTQRGPAVQAAYPPDGTPLEELLSLAIRKWLRQESTIVKSVPLIARGYVQLSLPASTVANNVVNLAHAVDVNSQAVTIPQGAYIVALAPENNAIRYTTGGPSPTPTQGMPLASGQIVTLALQELGGLQMCAQSSAALVNIEFFGAYV